MLAHGGWYLHQHVEEPDARFNIKYGHYDYVVLQEHSHPFDDVPGYIEAATTLASWIRIVDFANRGDNLFTVFYRFLRKRTAKSTAGTCDHPYSVQVFFTCLI